MFRDRPVQELPGYKRAAALIEKLQKNEQHGRLDTYSELRKKQLKIKGELLKMQAEEAKDETTRELLLLKSQLALKLFFHGHKGG